MGVQGAHPEDVSPGGLLVLEKFGKIDFGVLTVLLGGVYIPAQRGRGAAGGC
jgi:hypothetical protein